MPWFFSNYQHEDVISQNGQTYFYQLDCPLRINVTSRPPYDNISSRYRTGSCDVKLGEKWTWLCNQLIFHSNWGGEQQMVMPYKGCFVLLFCLDCQSRLLKTSKRRTSTTSNTKAMAMKHLLIQWRLKKMLPFVNILKCISLKWNFCIVIYILLQFYPLPSHHWLR